MFHSDSELLAYGSGFYTEKLSRDAKKRHMDSIESMRQFANSSECRRVGILRYFQEEPPYSKCNTCDNCATNIKFESDTNRDFSEEFILIANTIYANFGKVYNVLCF